MTPNRTRRKGLAIIPALVCLLLVSLLCVAMIKLSRTQRNAARDEQSRMQVEWLAESGASRARARLAADPDYRGETWKIPAEAIGGHKPAQVTIAVEAVENQAKRRRVRIVAGSSSGGGQAVKQSKQFVLEPRTKTETRGDRHEPWNAAPLRGIYPDRIAGRDRDHRRVDRSVAPGGAGGT